ncbi:MAG: deoxyribose-phosphate aldolase [Thermodesulfobacteriota bacterium]
MDNKLNLAKFIDHTLLKPYATESDIQQLCDEAQEYGFFSVCVHPFHIKTAKKSLSGTNVYPVRKKQGISSNRVKVSTVIGFPLGMTLTQVKIYEAMEAVLSGADELDIVINLGAVKAGKWKMVKKEISDLVTVTPKALHKIIIECSYLSDDEKIKASLASLEAGAEFVKTSTGFAPTGADLRDVETIKTATKGKIGIKAAGGIKTLKEVLGLLRAGASRIGTSSGVTIMKSYSSCKR